MRLCRQERPVALAYKGSEGGLKLGPVAILAQGDITCGKQSLQ